MTEVLKATIDSKDGWIATYTGRRITPLDPNPLDIDPMDIAHSLAHQCRFTGHVKEFYSVAQHSYMVSTLVPAEYALWGLLHDASEAYISDIARPVKKAEPFGSFYKAAEDVLTLAICERFGLEGGPELPPPVEKADNLMLWAEMRDLMPNDPPDGVEMYAEEVVPWSPSKSKSFWLRRYGELTGEYFEGYYPPEAKGMKAGKLWRSADIKSIRIPGPITGQ